MLIKKRRDILTAFALLLSSSCVFAQTTGSSFTTIRNILQADGVGGGCMIGIRQMPANGVCGNANAFGYVSMMCDGQNGVSKSEAKARFDTAFAAHVLGANINVTMTNEVLTEDGYCYAYDVRVNVNP
jgi:hypothetical protein